LRDELRALRLRQTAGGWSFDHASGRHDDRAVALSLALLGAIEAGSRQDFVFFDVPEEDEFARRLRVLGAGDQWAPPWMDRRW
jgi:cytosine/adenosine deaminase-related metal-dependent hydrolase